jgi:pyridoxal phosphate enzyme (YggS family)
MIRDNLLRIREKIALITEKCGRREEEIKLIAVTKTVSVEKIEEALSCGQRIIGENKVQEAREKYPYLKDKAEFYLIGHLQRNKVKQAIEIFDMIQSVDSLRLLQALEKELEKRNISNYPILLQFNTSGENSKFGVKPSDWEKFIEEIAANSLRTKVKGLMTIGAFTEDERVLRNCFITLRELSEKIAGLKLNNIDMQELSMGMSNDFELAIEEGATMVRVGSAIFGERNYK